MRKINFLLVMVIFCLTTVWSQEKNVLKISSLQKNLLKMQDVPKFDLSKELKLKRSLNLENAPAGILQNVKTFNFPNRLLRASAADELQVFYPRPSGAYLLGLDHELYHVEWPAIVAPALRKVTFTPYATDNDVTYSWTMNNTDRSADVVDGEFIFQGFPGWGYYMPELRGQLGTSTATYTYGRYKENGEEIEDQILYSSVGEVLPLTNADVWTGGLYGYVDSGHTAFFGPGAKSESKDQTGFYTVFEKPLAPLYVKDIDILFATTADGSVAVDAIPSGKTLTLNVYHLTDDRHIGDRIATSTVTKQDIITYQDEGQDTGMGFFPFSFNEIDDIGVTIEKTLLLETAFVVELTGYDSSFGFVVPFTVNMEFGGSTYGAYGQEIIAYKDGDWNICDACVQLNGAYNCLELEPGQDSLIVDDAGGYASFYIEGNDSGYYYGSILYSSLPYEDLTVREIPDWIEIVTVDTTDAEYGVLYYVLEGDPLPAEITGRSGRVVIASEGITTTIFVKQGDANWASISPVTAKDAITAIRQGDNFLLSYPPSATSVSIYNVTGQQTGEYRLNAGGKQTLPAANWAKGIYILKFKGTNKAVKVIK